MRIGIDLGGTTVKAALCAPDGTLLHKQSAPTPTGDATGLCAAMKQLALGLCAAQGAAPEQITSIGIGVPGSFDKATCTLKFGTNLGMSNVCFADAFRRSLDARYSWITMQTVQHWARRLRARQKTRAVC